MRSGLQLFVLSQSPAFLALQRDAAALVTVQSRRNSLCTQIFVIQGADQSKMSGCRATEWCREATQ